MFVVFQTGGNRVKYFTCEKQSDRTKSSLFSQQPGRESDAQQVLNRPSRLCYREGRGCQPSSVAVRNPLSAGVCACIRVGKAVGLPKWPVSQFLRCTAWRTRGAHAVQQEFMPETSKSVRQFQLQLGNAPFQLIRSLTAITPEMMMVRLPGALISSRFAGKLHGHERAFLYHRFQIAIHGGDAEVPHVLLCIVKRLLGRQWPPCFNKRRPDSILLSRISRFNRCSTWHRCPPSRN